MVSAVIVGSAAANVPWPGPDGLVRRLIIGLVLRYPFVPLIDIRGPAPDMTPVLFGASLELGAVLAMPLLVFQSLALLAGNRAQWNRGVALAAAGVGTLACLFGLVLGYAVAPRALLLLTGGNAMSLRFFFGSIVPLSFWMGVAGETPVLVPTLVRLGVMGTEQLVRWRPLAVLGAAAVAWVLAPVPTLLARAVAGVVLYSLYELGLQVSRRTSRSVTSV